MKIKIVDKNPNNGDCKWTGAGPIKGAIQATWRKSLALHLQQYCEEQEMKQKTVEAIVPKKP